MDVLLVYTTFPDGMIAREVGTQLVERQLAACISLCPGITSIYRWEGKVETADEVQALIKTTRIAYPELERALHELHPYELPEIIAVEITEGSKPYLDWVRATGEVDG